MCCSYLTYLPLGNQTPRHSLLYLLSHHGWEVEWLESVGSRGGPLCPEPVQMTERIRLTNPHVLRVRQAAKSSALGRRGERH